MLYLFIKFFVNHFVGIKIFLKAELICFQPVHVLFYLENFLNVLPKYPFFAKSAISNLLANFASFSFAAILFVRLLNVSVVIYLS